MSIATLDFDFDQEEHIFSVYIVSGNENEELWNLSINFLFDEISKPILGDNHDRMQKYILGLYSKVFFLSRMEILIDINLIPEIFKEKLRLNYNFYLSDNVKNLKYQFTTHISTKEHMIKYSKTMDELLFIKATYEYNNKKGLKHIFSSFPCDKTKLIIFLIKFPDVHFTDSVVMKYLSIAVDDVLLFLIDRNKLIYNDRTSLAYELRIRKSSGLLKENLIKNIPREYEV